MQRKDEDFITIINKNTQDVKAIFGYVELCRYLEVNNFDSDILSKVGKDNNFNLKIK